MIAPGQLDFLDPAVAAFLAGEPEFLLRAAQRPPEGFWRCWLLLGGRGSGKTRAGAEWVHARAMAGPVRIALVGETFADGREVMVDGPSGIRAIARRNRPDFEQSRRRLVWPNGSVAQLFSSEDPDGLRGPQFDLAWGDEMAKWKHLAETWDMLQFGLRLGTSPQLAITTTPRPLKLLKTLMAAPDTVTVRMRSADNQANLAPGFIAAMTDRYGGTRLGRQELDGELVEDRPGALWSRALIEASRTRHAGPFRRIVVGVDPPASAGERATCGIVVAGLEEGGRAVVLSDCSVTAASPAGWGQAVADACARFAADRVIAEINQGGDMVEAVLRSVDPALPIETVRAARGKILRAEPVAALYEQGRVAHLQVPGRDLAALEDEMAEYGPDQAGASPDRLDALVWALSALMLRPLADPRIRVL